MSNSQDLKAFIQSHRNDDVNALALKLTTGADTAFILRQVEGWQRLSHKVPSWSEIEDLHYPVRLSLEQCSSEATARYKQTIAERLCPSGKSFADLTGGFGVDFAFLARRFKHATYVEQNAELCSLFHHNAPLLNLPPTDIVESQADTFLKTMPLVDLLFLDPARRNEAGKKVAALADCSPDVTALWDTLLTKARFVMLKLSPMLDITAMLRQLNHVKEVHVVGLQGECKELLCVATKETPAKDEPIIYCSDSSFAFHFCREEEKRATPVFAQSIGTYLYDPATSVLKAGAFHLLCQRHGVEKLSPGTHLYTSDKLVKDFPGRTFRIVSSTGCSKQDIRPLRGLQANLAVRNFPAKAEELRAKWHIKDGGNTYLFACQDLQGKKMLICAERCSF